MRKVTVTYTDGRVQVFDSLKETSDVLKLALTSIPRIAAGGAKRTKLILGIEKIEIDVNRCRDIAGRRGRTGKCPIRCINKDGTVIEAESITEALKKIGLEGKNISLAIDDGFWHFNGEWKFESVSKPKNPYKWEEPVSDEVINKIYRYANSYLSRFTTTIPLEERKEMQQHVATIVASYVSQHRYHTPVVSNKILYLWCMDEGCKLVKKHFDRVSLLTEPNDPEADKDEFMDVISYKESTEYNMETMYRDMPENLIPLARAYEAGLDPLEIRTRLHLKHKEYKQLTAELVKWLKDRRA